MTTAGGATHLLTDANGQPIWPTTSIVSNSQATATGHSLGEATHSAEQAFHVISLVVVEPVVGLTTDSDDDGVDDSYERAFTGTLAYGANDDPNSNGISLLQAFTASVPPSAIPLAQPPADLDGDGLSNAFELQYFGSSTAGDPEDDDDGDGNSNHEEFLFGTDPLNPHSSPGQALTVTPNPDGTYKVTLFTQVGRRYLIEGTSDLKAYETLVAPRDGIDNPLTFTTPPTTDTFEAYRIRVLSP